MARAGGASTLSSAARKKRPARALFIGLCASVAYFGLFPYPLGKEIVARPRWAAELPLQAAIPLQPGAAELKEAPGGGPASFQLGDLLGYIDVDGAVLHAEKVLFRATLSDSGYVNYTRLGTDWIMRNPRGARLQSFSGSGYPLLSPDGGRFFIVKTDLTGIMELDGSGGVRWSRDVPGFMTSASIQGDELLLGLIDGSMILLNRQGMPVFERSFTESRIPVILGAAVSPDGGLLAAISGIEPQKLTVLRRQGASYAVIAQTALASDFRREVRLAFAPDARSLLLEGERAVGWFDPSARRLDWAPLRGALAGLSFIRGGRWAAAAAQEGSLAELLILAPRGVTAARELFPARELFVGSVAGQLLVGLDGRLLRIDVEEM
jgi:hypothetical protein